MFLEAQFGDCVTPLPRGSRPENAPKEIANAPEGEDMDLDTLNQLIPGVQIKIDNLVANVWFETLLIECKNESLRMRIKTVVERAVETVAPFVDLVGPGY